MLRVPYLERLLEAVRDGTPLNHLQDALRPAVIQAHDDLATYITELVLALDLITRLRQPGHAPPPDAGPVAPPPLLYQINSQG